MIDLAKVGRVLLGIAAVCLVLFAGLTWRDHTVRRDFRRRQIEDSLKIAEQRHRADAVRAQARADVAQRRADSLAVTLAHAEARLADSIAAWRRRKATLIARVDAAVPPIPADSANGGSGAFTAPFLQLLEDADATLQQCADTLQACHARADVLDSVVTAQRAALTAQDVALADAAARLKAERQRRPGLVQRAAGAGRWLLVGAVAGLLLR